MKLIVNWLIDLVFPPRCLACRAYGAALCHDCLERIPTRHQQECLVCKRPARDGVPCRSCAPHTMVDRLCIAGDANHPLLAQAIHTLKYTSVRGLAIPLTEYLVQALAMRDPASAFADNPLLIPVPLHPRRHAERGFNQSELLADQLARRIHIAHRSDVLTRIRHTTSQVKTASRWERMENMRDAFHVPHPEQVAGRSIILVDDVCTTGATLDACAHALKDAGASSVTAVVLARG